MTLKHLALISASFLIRAFAEVLAQQAARYMVRLLRRAKRQTVSQPKPQ